MRFNTKYIYKGDSKDVIVKKINYNFDQILFFAVGPNGHLGPKGPTGYPGPVGKKGPSGEKGQRANLWFKQNTQPVYSDPQYLDMWIDSSMGNLVKEYGPTGSWVSTGYSLYSSTYFQAYTGISGPAGVTDKNVIAFSNAGGITASETSLVISDSALNAANSNPGRSKLLISTDDQITNPILTFSKTALVSSSSPSFYWRNLGSSPSLRWASGYDLSISPVLGFNIDTVTARTILYGNNGTITTNGNLTIRGTSDFFISSNTTVGGGSPFVVYATNMELSSSYYLARNPVKIQSGETGAFALDSTKNVTGTPSSLYGVSIEYGTNSIDNVFEFNDSNNVTIFSGKPRGAVGSAKYLQTVFGSTGGMDTGGTAGPYFYTAKRLKEVRQSTVSKNCIMYGSGATVPTYNLTSVIEMTDVTLWDSNTIMVTPTNPSSSYVPSDGQFGVYLKIPSGFLNSSLFYSSPYQANQFRVIINDIRPPSGSEAPNADLKIVGLVWDYYNYSGDTLTATYQYFLKFPFTNDIDGTISNPYFWNGCSYVDLLWSPITSMTNGNPKILWKTCTGAGGFVNVTNKFSSGAPVVPPPTGSSGGGGGTPPGGGGGGTPGGGGGGGGCFLPGTMISMADGTFKPIEEIEIGDLVLSYDFEKSQVVEDSVIDAFDYLSKDFVKMTLSDGTSVKSTQDHPYWAVGRGWVSFDPELTYRNYSISTLKVEVGDTLLSDKSELITIETVESSSVGDFLRTYNFHASKNRNYFANGVLVHNKIPVEYLEYI